MSSHKRTPKKKIQTTGISFRSALTYKVDPPKYNCKTTCYHAYTDCDALPECTIGDPHFRHALKPDDPRTAGEVNVGERCKGRVEKLHDVKGLASLSVDWLGNVKGNAHHISYTLQGNVL